MCNAHHVTPLVETTWTTQGISWTKCATCWGHGVLKTSKVVLLARQWRPQVDVWQSHSTWPPLTFLSCESSVSRSTVLLRDSPDIRSCFFIWTLSELIVFKWREFSSSNRFMFDFIANCSCSCDMSSYQGTSHNTYVLKLCLNFWQRKSKELNIFFWGKIIAEHYMK